jgi:hypothetical protein
MSLISKLAVALVVVFIAPGFSAVAAQHGKLRGPHRYPQQEDLRNRVGPQHGLDDKRWQP